MYLFLSDLHLGRGSAAESRAAEADALALLRAHEPELREAARAGTGGLYLLGDVFDQYLEYRHLVPKGFVRLQGLLAAWADAGVPVTYVLGNRDPWHLDHFERELGVRLLREARTERLAGLETYIAHGDGLVPEEWAYNRLRGLLRHPAAYRLYRNAFPGDAGYRLARLVARLGSGEPEERVVAALREAARQRLARAEAELVVMGHAHHAELSRWEEGAYLNPGYWFGARTFARLDGRGPALLRWSGAEALPLHPPQHPGSDGRSGPA